MRVSVVVTIVDAGAALERCLTALVDQDDPPELEIIVPFDDTLPGLPALAGRFPGIRFLPMGRVATARPAHTPRGQHELFDKRRSAGLKAATGDVVAILEDRGVPRADWARMMVRLHEWFPNPVIGGGIGNKRDTLLNWAVYFCDFGRYQPPFDAGARNWVSDTNVSYKRRVLDRTRELWSDRYHETTVHWALQRSGVTLFLTPDLLVEQMRDDLTLSSLIRERAAWGRIFAETRAREVKLPQRIGLALLAPFLPLLLFARLARLQAVKRVTTGAFVRASPIIAVLLMAWSVGEALGYLSKERA